MSDRPSPATVHGGWVKPGTKATRSSVLVLALKFKAGSVLNCSSQQLVLYFSFSRSDISRAARLLSPTHAAVATGASEG